MKYKFFKISSDHLKQLLTKAWIQNHFNHQLLQNDRKIYLSIYHVPKFLTFLLTILLIFSSPHTTEALPLLSHKHHAVLAESYVRYENLTPIRPPTLSHRAAGGTPAKHLSERDKKQKGGIEVLVTIFIYRTPYGPDPALYNCVHGRLDKNTQSKATLDISIIQPVTHTNILELRQQ